MKKKTQMEIIIVVFLIVVLGGLLITTPEKKEKRSVAQLDPAKIESIMELFTHNDILCGEEQLAGHVRAYCEKQRKKPYGRNPFALTVDTATEEPLAGEVVTDREAPQVSIQGVLYVKDDPQSSIAIIGGQEKKVGDSVNGWTIVRIRDNVVYFQNGQQVYKSHLYKDT